MPCRTLCACIMRFSLMAVAARILERNAASCASCSSQQDPYMPAIFRGRAPLALLLVSSPTRQPESRALVSTRSFFRVRNRRPAGCHGDPRARRAHWLGCAPCETTSAKPSVFSRTAPSCEQRASRKFGCRRKRSIGFSRSAKRSLFCEGAMSYEAPILMSHTGSGGMTSSLSIGTQGPANVRKLRQFPLSPILNTGRSQLSASSKLEDPRFHNVNISRQDLGMLAGSQWSSRSRPVHSRAEIEAALKQF